MQFKESKLAAAIETAKAKANRNKALLNAIDKAATGLRRAWSVTELHDGLMVTTESGETYHANVVCHEWQTAQAAISRTPVQVGIRGIEAPAQRRGVGTGNR
jgi:hypothetical protein